MSNPIDTVSELTSEAQRIVVNAQAWDAIDPAFGPDACERVLARVEAVTAAPPDDRRGPGRLVLVALLAAVVGGGMGARAILASQEKPAVALVASAHAATLPATATPQPPAEVPSIDVAALPTAPLEATAARAPSPVAEATTLSEELRLTTAARKALSAGDPSGALRALSEHERRFPDGQLAQERDSVRVQALIADGRVPEAQARAAAFRARYPGGLLLPSVERALGSRD